MKVGVRVTGTGFRRAEALVAEVRRRAVERLEARRAERERAARTERRESDATKPPQR